MSRADVENEILTPMQRLFLPPLRMSETEQVSALSEYGRALESFEAVDLKYAWQNVRDSHLQRSWPAIGLFMVQARIARKNRVGDPPRQGFKPDKTPDEKLALWLGVRGTSLAATAVCMELCWALKCAVLNDGKLAHEIDLRAMRLAKDQAERTHADIEAGRPIEYKGRLLTVVDENRKVALDMWRTLLVREAETAQEIARHQQRNAA